MILAFSIAVLIPLAALSILLWLWRESAGSIETRASLKGPELTDEIVNHFTSDGWDVERQTDDVLLLQRSADVWVGMLLLVLFFPVGLLYLFTDRGYGSLKVTYREYGGSGTKFLLEWHHAVVRGQVRRLLEWLEEIDHDVGLKLSA